MVTIGMSSREETAHNSAWYVPPVPIEKLREELAGELASIGAKAMGKIGERVQRQPDGKMTFPPNRNLVEAVLLMTKFFGTHEQHLLATALNACKEKKKVMKDRLHRLSSLLCDQMGEGRIRACRGEMEMLRLDLKHLNPARRERANSV